ncbi:hypothetical protein G9A89_007172 [Geosiphon pyriformis]|nr:hypothetical protein G9A89_007172 [Geosiphon pyriformis]
MRSISNRNAKNGTLLKLFLNPKLILKQKRQNFKLAENNLGISTNQRKPLEKFVVRNPITIKSLAEGAYYAREASCLKAPFDSLGHGLYGAIRSKSHTDAGLLKEFIILFGAFEKSFITWKQRSNVLVDYAFGDGAKVDGKLYDIWLSVRKNIWAKFAEQKIDLQRLKNLNSKFVFIGFGEAGVFSVFAALTIGKLGKHKPVVFTFGSPKMGDKKFAQYVYSNSIVHRVTYAGDYLPAFPLDDQYRHLTTEYWIPEQEESCECLSEEKSIQEKQFPEIYVCLKTQEFYENQACNAQYDRIKRMEQKTLVNYHFGPYFGHIMGECSDE